MFNYTSLVPLENAANAKIRSSLLTFENKIHILADPGWDTVTDLTHFESIINSIDIILLSQPTMEFLGAFAYLYKKHTATMKKIKIFSTSPVSNLGRVETIESYRASGLVGPVLTYQMEINDIEEAFDSILTVKHNQSIIYHKDEDEEQEDKAASDSLTLTALNSGHTLGGIIWHLNMNSEKVIYSPAWNHSRDSYLDGAKILQENGTATAILARPSVIITSSKVGSPIPYPNRVSKFLKLVDATLQNSGTVLLPVSLGSRFLELVHLIDDHLRSSPYQVYLVAKTGTRTLTYAGSMLEWMSPVATKEWQSRGKVPFAASTVTMINPEELELLKGSKIVFCTGESFEEGSSSFESFRHLCNDPTTTILLTEKTKKGSLAHDLYLYWEKMAKLRNQGKAEDGVPVPYQSSLQVKYIYEENVDPQTIVEFTELVKSRREADKKLKEELQSSVKQVNYNNLTAEEQMLLTIDKKEKILDDGEENDDDEDDDDDDDNNKNDQNDEKAKQKETKEILNENLPLDINARLMKGTNRMFPYIPKNAKFDDYGEIINAKDYARKDPRYELFHNTHNKNYKVGEKRGFEKDMVYSKRKKIEKETKKADEMIDFDPLVHPKKRCERQISLFTKCALSYVDLASLVDLRSFCLLIPLLKPKKVILLEDLSDDAASKLVYDSLNSVNLRNRAGVVASNGLKQQLFDITQAKNNHEIQFSEKISSLDVFLDEEIIRNIKWQHITGGVRIAQIVGNIVRRKDVDCENEEETEKGNNGDTELPETDVSLDANGESSSILKADEMRSGGIGLKGIDEEALKNMNIRSAELSIGDIKLTELKSSFTGYSAEFKGEGMLVIDDKICVKKINEGDFAVEGSPSKLFYEVRAKIKSMLAFV